MSGYEEIAVGAGADGLIDCISQATLDPGDEIVCGWPSFPSYVIDAAKQGGVCGEGASAGRPLRPGCPARRDHAADERRLRLPPEQPDRDDEHAGRARRLPRRRPRPRARRDRPGVPRVRRRPRLPGRDRGVLQGRPPRRRTEDVLEDLRPRRAARRLHGRAGGGGHRGEQGQARVRRLQRGAVGCARQPRRLRGARTPPQRQRRGDGRARPDPPRPGSRAGRAGGRELPLRRRRRRLPPAVRGAAPGGRDRPPAARASARRPRSASPPGRPEENRFFADALASARGSVPAR